MKPTNIFSSQEKFFEQKIKNQAKKISLKQSEKNEIYITNELKICEEIDAADENK